MSASPAPGTPPVLGIIGGSGVYDIPGLTNVRWKHVSTPWGDPSDELMFGELAVQKLVFLPRHARGHRVPPSGDVAVGISGAITRQYSNWAATAGARRDARTPGVVA